MTQDEIIEMAVEVGINKVIAELNIELLEAFAKLIAAKEREACAKVCDKKSVPQKGKLRNDVQCGAVNLANAIRARGEA